MKTLIVYGSKYGTTEKCSEMLKSKINGNVEIVNLKNKMVKDLESFDNIVIGGSIYIGKIQKEITQFCEKNTDLLIKKRVGIFVCCMGEEKVVEEQISKSFSESILKNAIFAESFGGSYNFSKMNFLEKKIIKKVAGVSADVNKINEDKINEIAKLINGED